MVNRVYRIFYDFGGPTKSEPLREQKAPEEIQAALNRFADELSTCFGEEQEFSASTERGKTENERVLRVSVLADDDEFEMSLKRILNCNDLYGRKVE